MAKSRFVWGVKSIVLLVVVLILVGIVVAQLIIKKGDAAGKRVALAPGEENWVDACSFLSQPVKDEVSRLEHLIQNSSEWNITFVENEWMNKNDYFLTRYGEQLYRVKSIINRTFGFGEDRITFKGGFSGDTYETTILSEGKGVVFIGGKSCDVEYRGDSEIPGEPFPDQLREVRVNCPPLDQIDTFFCQFGVNFCADSDGGVSEFFGKTVNATFSFDDYCINDKTVLEGFCDLGAVRTSELDCPLACVHGSCATEVNICPILDGPVNDTDRFKIRNKVGNLLSIGATFNFEENQWMHNGTYFLNRFGEKLFRVLAVGNETNGFSSDKVFLLGGFSGTIYKSTINSEGFGTVNLGGGWLCNVEYRGASDIVEDLRQVRINCPPFEQIDTTYCQFNYCTDSDGGNVLSLKGIAMNLTTNGTDVCVYNATSRSYNLLKEFYCNAWTVSYGTVLCPALNGTTNSCFNGACGGGSASFNAALNVTKNSTRLPDLVPKWLSIRGTGMFNETDCNMTATANITNIGLALAGVSKTEFLMINDVRPNIPLFDTPGLNPGASAQHSAKYVMVKGLVYNFTVTADKTSLVNEKNEINNRQHMRFNNKGFNLTSCNLVGQIEFYYNSDGTMTNWVGGIGVGS